MRKCKSWIGIMGAVLSLGDICWRMQMNQLERPELSAKNMASARNSVLNRLPAFYQAFYKEWKHGNQTPVHYQPEPGKWKRNPETGEVTRIQNKPIPLKYPAELENCLLGGEALVQGFQKRHDLRRRVPHYWFPTLQTGVVYSEILDQHMEVVCTKRLLRLVDEHYGFDSYILETAPQDLKTNLALKIKQKLLLALARKDFLPHNPKKREELLQKYQKHIIPEQEAEWYGLSLKEAFEKLEKEAPKPPPAQPLKLKFREEFIQQLREMQSQPEVAPSNKSWKSVFSRFTGGRE